jgi:hypothetical protein
MVASGDGVFVSTGSVFGAGAGGTSAFVSRERGSASGAGSMMAGDFFARFGAGAEVCSMTRVGSGAGAGAAA